MGTSLFGVRVLETLAKAEKVCIVGVVTRPHQPAGRGLRLTPSPVYQAAEKLGLPVWQPPKINSSDFVDFLRGLGCDVFVVAAYGQILKKELLCLPPLGCLNVHASLLPRFRGPDPIRWAILKGDEVTGVTIMLMDEGVDTGPILAQQAIPITPQDNYLSLIEKLGIMGGKLLCEVLPSWREGKIIPRPQEGESSYAPFVNKEETRIHWEEPASHIVRRVRAFYPSPGAYTLFRGKRLKILEARWEERRNGTSCPPGTIYRIERREGIAVCAGEGLVIILRVQPEGKRVMSAWEFVCGYRLSEGQKVNEGGEGNALF